MGATRAMALNFGMLGFNAKTKDVLKDLGQSSTVQVVGGAFIGGLSGSIFSLPFDYVKTQVQKMKADPVTGEMPFKGPVDCAMKTFRASPVKFYSGFLVYFARTGPLASITLVFQDLVKRMWVQMGV